jgi:mannose-6-phosphate isomerase-like protein (cupin superfamily)
MSTDSVGPIGLASDALEARLWGDSLAIIKATSETTAGRLTVIDNYGRRGPGSPLHIHHNEGEGFYVVDGMMRIWVGGKAIDASAGSFVYGPPHVPHMIEVTSPVAHFLYITEPAGFEQFVRAVTTPAEEITLPPKGSGQEPDLDDMTVIAARYGIEILGPPGTIPTQ